MFAKIFAQIFDSSIAENYEVRHVFEDLLKLADKTGVVDMTVEAVARRTNAPIEKVQFGIGELMKPDPRSRSKEHEGRRLILVDSRRDWGWIIVNYDHYREIQDEEARRSSWRDSKAKQRAGAKKSKRVKANVGDDGKPVSLGYRMNETANVRLSENGASQDEVDRHLTSTLPKALQ